MANERSVSVVSATVQGDKVLATIQMNGEVTRLEGSKEIWKAKTRYQVSYELSLNEILERFGADRKIKLAGALRTTSPDFIVELNQGSVKTEAEIMKLADPFVKKQAAIDAAEKMTEEQLKAQIAKMEAILKLKQGK